MKNPTSRRLFQSTTDLIDARTVARADGDSATLGRSVVQAWRWVGGDAIVFSPSYSRGVVVIRDGNRIFVLDMDSLFGAMRYLGIDTGRFTIHLDPRVVRALRARKAAALALELKTTIALRCAA